MNEWIRLQEKLVPELLPLMEERYTILKTISQFQPIGRRALAEQVNNTERHIRGEIEFLEKQGFIEITNKGMFVTDSGKRVVEAYLSLLGKVSNISGLEKKMKQLFNLKNVFIVPGDSDQSEDVKKEMGEQAASFIMNHLTADAIISVTGGSTVAAVADYLTPVENVTPLLVPARGGLGSHYEYQANSICVKMAQQLKGSYRLLHIPDHVSHESYETMKNEPDVKEVTALMNQADIVIHGVGSAIKMAKRRNSDEAILTKIKNDEATGEAFGYYFDREGNTIHKVNSIGITKEQLQQVQLVLTVAGGSSKAEALSSYFKWGKIDCLVTDEAAANKLISMQK